MKEKDCRVSDVETVLKIPGIIATPKILCLGEFFKIKVIFVPEVDNRAIAHPDYQDLIFMFKNLGTDPEVIQRNLNLLSEPHYLAWIETPQQPVAVFVGIGDIVSWALKNLESQIVHTLGSFSKKSQNSFRFYQDSLKDTHAKTFVLHKRIGWEIRNKNKKI